MAQGNDLHRPAVAAGQTLDKKAEAQFLADEFGVLPRRAAELLEPDPSAAEDLAAAVLAEDRERDELDAVPVPDPAHDPDHLEPRIGDLEKPVVGQKSGTSPGDDRG